MLRPSGGVWAGVVLGLACAGSVRGEEPRKVDVGGRSLLMRSWGEGGPTVVIETGMGEPVVETGSWGTVCEAVAKTNRVVLYDRAGLGGSDRAPGKARTSRDVAKDLHAMLEAADVPGPYVLVGHSIGGLHVRAFVDAYPDEVAGVVLADATHPDQDVEWLAVLPAEAAGEPEAVTMGRRFLRGRVENPTANPEGLDLVASGEQVRETTLGMKPLVVVSHSPEWKMAPGLPDEVSRALEGVSMRLQKSFLALSKDSTHHVAKTAGHGLHVEDPELVIEAIREVVGKVRGGGR